MDQLINHFLQFSWATPSDILLRIAEHAIWHEQQFVRPVLDIGCADGLVGDLVYSGHPHIDMGIDLDPKNIATFKSNSIYRQVQVADARKLPFKTSSFSTIVCNSTLEHIEKSDLPAIKEIARVLKPGGSFMFTVPSPRFYDAVKTVSGNAGDFAKYNERVAHYHYRSLLQWQNILEKNHLQISNHQYYFSQTVIPVWYKLYQLAITKLFRRELWSYLRDSKISFLVPKSVIKTLEYPLVKYLVGLSFHPPGTWLFVKAVKQ